MRDSDLRSAPPVPPRRLKRKTRPVIGSADEVAKAAATTPVLRSERRLKLPPPPPPPPAPPQRVPIRQKIHPAEIPPAEKSSRSSQCRSSNFYNSRGSINGDKQSAVNDVDLRTPLSTFGTTLCRPISKGNPFGRKISSEEPPRRHSKDRAIVRRPNEYPPLFFTIQDFQEVMADVENSYSRTLRNMTTFEPTPRPRRPRDVLKRDEVTDLPETPKGQVLFRVTTTNVPFEKCLNGWGDSGNDPNHFIFEDYVDRRQFPPQRREPASKKLVLFGDDTFDRDEEEQSTSTSRTTTRVRFLVDPPGEETAEKITDLDSLQNIDSLPADNDIELGNAVSKDNPEEEIAEDEFGDIPFTSLLSSNGSSLLAEPSEDSTSSKTDFQTILVKATVEKIPDPKKQREFDAEGVKPSGEDARVNSSIVEATSVGKDTVEKLLGVSAVDLHADEMEKNSPTVKARRNSFLMNMLQDENEPEIKEEKAKEKVACKVVATHPKTPIRSCASRVDEMRSSTAVEAKNKLLGELSSNFSAVRLKPATTNGVDNLRSENCDVESDSWEKLSPDLDSVLLDSNVVKCNKVNEEPIIEEEKKEDKEKEENKKSRRLRKEPRTSSAYVCSQKTDQFIDRREKKYFQDGVVIEGINRDAELIEGERDIGEKLEEGLMENNCKNNDEKSKNIMNKNDDYNVESASRSSVDKCAIVRRCNDINIDDITYNNINNNNNNNNINNINNNNNYNNNNNNNNDKSNNNINNNNNDNNAMTPVDLSYDQSPKVLSIIPGSVKSFVKFYEIRGETNVGLNVSESPSTPKIRIEEISGNENTASNDFGEKNSENYLAKHPGEIENDIKYTIVARKEIRTGNKDSATQNQTPIVDPRNDRFDKCARRIVPGENRLSPSHLMPVKDRANHEEMGKESEIATKSSAPSKKSAMRTRNAVPEIVHEKKDGPIDGEIRGVVMSSTTSQSVPKSTTTTFDGRYTFYCTV